MRLHAPTKASTLGVGGVLLASMILAAAEGRMGFAELLITLFVFVTAPVSANLMAQAALHLRDPIAREHFVTTDLGRHHANDLQPWVPCSPAHTILTRNLIFIRSRVIAGRRRDHRALEGSCLGSRVRG
jgi:monovalent cation/proton antiporter MnhG/PhaG subunit